MNKRLDQLIAEKHSISRTHATRLIDTGLVTWRDKPVKSSMRLTPEEFEQVEVTLAKPEKLHLQPEKIKLNIIYEDKDLIVIHKPVGMVVHPACGHHSGTLVHALLYHCKDLSGINGTERPGIVHRIDKDTEGLLVVAKNDYAHKFLSKQFEKHTITRKYIALVKGNLHNDQGTIKGNLARSVQNRKKISVVPSGGRNAVTHYKVLKRFLSVTLLELTLETGRTHQIRVHLAFLGHPVIGDSVYNKDYNNQNTAQNLIAYKLGFIHPKTKKYVEFNAELPKWTKK